MEELRLWLSEKLDHSRPVIALVGLRGAGKTTIGEKVAGRLKKKFVELDERVESSAGLTLQNIFEVHGEEYYRRLEREVLVEFLAARPSAVIGSWRWNCHARRYIWITSPTLRHILAESRSRRSLEPRIRTRSPSHG